MSHSNLEVSSSPAVILGDDSLLLKYLNKNLLACATVSVQEQGPRFIKVIVLDTVSGRIIYEQRHTNGAAPVHATFSENWLVYTYFRDDDAKRTEMVSIVFYERAVLPSQQYLCTDCYQGGQV